MGESFFGHFWTIAPHIVHLWSPERAPRDEPWDTTLADPHWGEVRLTGWLRARPGGNNLVILIHGLGGSAESRYIHRAARAADQAGISYLRLNLRGADRSGEDVYHAGQSEDLRATLASPALAHFERIYVIGYSMGGHISMRWSTEADRDPRVKGIVAVCAPLDLRYGVHAIQRLAGLPYQWWVLNGLKEMYRAAVTARRRALPIPLERALRLKTIIEWDDEVVVPRFGFDSREHYYETQSAGQCLPHIDLPTLFVAAETDPVVTADQLRPWLRHASDAIEIAWTGRGGHVGFPDDLILRGQDVGPLEPQLIRWLLKQT